jgi:DNA-binding response OmpR family regulator
VVASDPPDLVVLDLMLPGMDGLEVCRRLRADVEVGARVAVIMLTALGEGDDRLTGLSLGADDYVTKPFSPRELALRAGSVLRRLGVSEAASEGPVVLRDAELIVDNAARVARLAGRELRLTVREFDLLAFLMANPRRVFTRADLLELVWGWSFGDYSTVTVHVKRLRAKLEADDGSERISTVYGVGYRYDPREGQ